MIIYNAIIKNLMPPIINNQKLLIIIPWRPNMYNHVINNLPAPIRY
jgi:hypothetical protein